MQWRHCIKRRRTKGNRGSHTNSEDTRVEGDLSGVTLRPKTVYWGRSIGSLVGRGGYTPQCRLMTTPIRDPTEWQETNQRGEKIVNLSKGSNLMDKQFWIWPKRKGMIWDWLPQLGRKTQKSVWHTCVIYELILLQLLFSFTQIGFLHHETR